MRTNHWRSSRKGPESTSPGAIEAALTEAKGRVSGPFGAATRGVPASTLESKIKALQIDKRRFKSE